MSRVEENKEMVDAIDKIPAEFYKNEVTRTVCYIGALIDISKSLAVIADAMSEEESNEEEPGPTTP